MKVIKVECPVENDLRECPCCHGFGGKHYANRACSSTGITEHGMVIHFRPRGELIVANDLPTELVSVASRWMVG